MNKKLVNIISVIIIVIVVVIIQDLPGEWY